MKRECPIIVTNVKPFKKIKLSDDEIWLLMRMVDKKDEEGIKKLFSDNDKYHMDPTGLSVIRCDDCIIMFGYHRFQNKQIILIVYKGIVYEFTAKWRQRLFLSGVTNTIYSTGTPLFGITEHAKPVQISFANPNNTY